MYKPPRCKDCEYWRKEDRVDKKPLGQCKIDCPQMGPNGYGYWPVTNESDFCYRGKTIEPEMVNG